MQQLDALIICNVNHTPEATWSYALFIYLSCFLAHGSSHKSSCILFHFKDSKMSSKPKLTDSHLPSALFKASAFTTSFHSLFIYYFEYFFNDHWLTWMTAIQSLTQWTNLILHITLKFVKKNPMLLHRVWHSLVCRKSASGRFSAFYCIILFVCND